MTYSLMFILILKHVFVSHFLDLGYSFSRDRREALWPKGLITNIISELSCTALVFLFMTGDFEFSTLVVESFALLISCLIERWCSYSNLLTSHLASELLIVATYALFAYDVGIH